MAEKKNFGPEEYQALLASIVDSSEDAIISKDPDGVITSWNQGAEKLFGYTAKEAIGQPILMLFPADRIMEEARILSKIRGGERVRHYDTVRRRKDGFLIDVSVTVSPVRKTDGTIIGASKIARDISKEKAAQEKLRLSEERFRVTLSSIGDAVVATNDNGNIEYMNPVAENLTGWNMKEAAGQSLTSVFKIVNEFTGRPVENPATKVLREGNIVGLANHTVLISRDGKEWPIDDSGAPIRDGTASKITGVVVVFRDITERRRAEMSALRLAAIVQNSDDAIISKDLSGVITSWNEGAERIFGYSAGETVGKSIKMIIPPELQSEEDEILRRLRRGERIYHFETRRVTKDKSIVPVSLTISPIKDQNGEIIGASKIARVIRTEKS